MAKPINHRLQFFDSPRFIASSLSNLVDNLAKGTHKVKCKYGHDDKNMKLVELNTKIASVALNGQAL